jgi:ribonuclease Z
MLAYLAAAPGVVLCGMGLLFLFAPGLMTETFAVMPTGPAGYATLRADLGALFLGIGSFAVAGGLRRSAALLRVPLVFIGIIVAGRLVGFLLDGFSRASMQLLIPELVFSAIWIGAMRSFPSPVPVRRRTAALATTIGVGLLALLAAAVTLQRPLGLQLAGRAMTTARAQQRVAALPDGLHAGLCGSGSPMPDVTRSGPCVVVIAGQQVFVVDAGDGGPRTLGLMGVPPARVDGVLLTHFHSDHIGGLGELLLQRWAGGSHAEQLPVIGPQGVESVVDGFNLAYGLDKGYRVAHHGEATVPPSGSGGAARPFTIEKDTTTRQVVWSKDGLTITAFPVDHTPVFPAVGYRFDYGGRSLVISGDTAPSESLRQASEGVDLLLHEGLQTALVSLMNRAAILNNRSTMAKITADIPSYHTTPEDAARLAARAGVRELVFYHTIPPLPNRLLNSAFLGDAPTIYRGPITVSRDGQLFSLPAGTTTITRRDLL